MPNMFRSLALRDYRVYVFGHLFSQAGTWMQRLGVIWAVFEITDSGVSTGIASACLFGPALLLSPLAGLLVDRRNLRNILLATKVGLSASAVLFTLIGFNNPTSPGPYFVVAACFGIVETFDIPARMAFIGELVERPDLPNAVGLNTATMNLSRVIGPTIGGVLISTVGVEWSFATNFVLSLAVLASMLSIKPKFQPPDVSADQGGVLAGFSVAWLDPTLRNVFLLYTMLSIFVMAFPVTLPLFADRVLSGGAGIFTLLFAALSAGSILGALVVARQSSPDLRFLGGTGLWTALSLLALAVAPTTAIATAAAFVVGTTTMAFITGAITAVQLSAPQATRGRVLALISMIGVGSRALGGLLIGWIVDVFDARLAVGLGSMVALLGGTLSLLEVRRLGQVAEVPVLAGPLPSVERD